jgi:hypothetical protein
MRYELSDYEWTAIKPMDRIMDALAAGHDAAVQMIDTSVVRVHQHGACISDNNHHNPEDREWYQALMQPDVPNASCCCEADAYWADEIHVRDGKTYVTITDDRPDEPRGRPHVDMGTEIEIPTNKLKWDRSNPTGHGIVFLSRNRYVFCLRSARRGLIDDGDPARSYFTRDYFMSRSSA